MANVDQDYNLDGATEGNSDANAPLKINSDDPGWNYGTLCAPLNKDAIKCKLCGFICKAGITRLKYHGPRRKGEAICVHWTSLQIKTRQKQLNVCFSLLATWWMNYGNSTPTLQKMAIKILSLTTSSSGCERNWSDFKGIHTKKRNRLDSQRLHKLVFVQFNSKLINKWEGNKNQNIDVLRSLDASKAQSWIVAINDDDEEMEEGEGLEVGGEAIDNANQEARELHDDDFVLDEEQVECEEDFEFNSDEEGFVDRNEDYY
uniref:HAT C-terminal dimerisation domain-containing protein n=1 Tax=Lactuca sativa TaxID=4236 RepID=A0A9R1VL24_LACSA|nr:hypothetical protein LSAT_V11C400221430 [Lactuca sativa]